MTEHNSVLEYGAAVQHSLCKQTFFHFFPLLYYLELFIVLHYFYTANFMANNINLLLVTFSFCLFMFKMIKCFGKENYVNRLK